MELEKWNELYESIVKRLSLDVTRDEAASKILFNLLEGRETIRPEALRERINGKAIAVYGAGPSLDDGVCRMIKSGLYDKFIHLAADGATSAFIERGLIPSIIFTDLDGSAGDLIDTNKAGSWIIVHGHGDNIEPLKRLVPLMEGPILGSTQVQPIPPKVLNFGGFTDGDRAVYWASELGASKILLVGMDFGTEVGRHSKPELEGDRLKLKLEKLKLGRELVEIIAEERDLYCSSSGGECLTNISRINWEDIGDLIKG